MVPGSGPLHDSHDASDQSTENGRALTVSPLPQGEPPRPPALPPRFAAQEQQRQREFKQREGAERRSMLRGLLLLAAAVIVFAILQFGWSRAFPSGWWHRW